jgi:hypothetical protein
LALALKVWKESAASAAKEFEKTSSLPVPIAELAQELWQRAIVAASVELKRGSTARARQAEGDEAEALRGQVTSLRRELERESMLYGELRAQAARHETIARDALARLESSEARERKRLRDLGSARAHIAELVATLGQLRARPVAVKDPRAHPSSRLKPKAKARRSGVARNRPASAPRVPIKPRNRKFVTARGGNPSAGSGRKKTARTAAAAWKRR